MNERVLDNLAAAVQGAIGRIASLERQLTERASATPDPAEAAEADSRARELQRQIEQLRFENTQMSEQLAAGRYHEEQLRQENQRLMQTVTQTRQKLEKLFSQIEGIQ